MRRLFRIGPIVLLPLVILWGEVCYRIGAGEAQDWWRVYPFFAACAVAVIWHLALIVTGGDRFHYAMYALAHVPILLITSFMYLIYATRAPL